MNQQFQITKRNESEFVISYLVLRRAVGILGIALPLVLLIDFFFLKQGCTLPPSISHYYYTSFGTYFTGTLCAVALFLYSYNGPEAMDNRAALFAAVCALGVAFIPANCYCENCDTCIRVHLDNSPFRNGIHYALAGLLFLTLAYFCLYLFTKTSPAGPTNEKRTRNLIYKVCGITILTCIIFIPIFDFTPVGKLPVIKDFKLWTFVFEALALFAFGFSWLIKGETFFKDK